MILSAVVNVSPKGMNKLNDNIEFMVKNFSCSVDTKIISVNNGNSEIEIKIECNSSSVSDFMSESFDSLIKYYSFRL